MENLANSYAANPVPPKKFRSLPVFFIINWKSLLDLSAGEPVMQWSFRQWPSGAHIGELIEPKP
jgi:hypothetical protein